MIACKYFTVRQIPHCFQAEPPALSSLQVFHCEANLWIQSAYTLLAAPRLTPRYRPHKMLGAIIEEEDDDPPVMVPPTKNDKKTKKRKKKAAAAAEDKAEGGEGQPSSRHKRKRKAKSSDPEGSNDSITSIAERPCLLDALDATSSASNQHKKASIQLLQAFEFHDYACAKAFDILSKGMYKKFLAQSRNAGEEWACNVVRSVVKVQGIVSSIQLLIQVCTSFFVNLILIGCCLIVFSWVEQEMPSWKLPAGCGIDAASLAEACVEVADTAMPPGLYCCICDGNPMHANVTMFLEQEGRGGIAPLRAASLGLTSPWRRVLRSSRGGISSSSSRLPEQSSRWWMIATTRNHLARGKGKGGGRRL